jgi:hypothetical protein
LSKSIDQQRGFLTGVTDQHIKITITVNVTKRCATTDLRRRGTHKVEVFEKRSSAILEELIGLSVGKAFSDEFYVVQYMSIDDQQIPITIIVEIEKPCSETQKSVVCLS